MADELMITIACDECGNDLSTDHPYPRYRVLVKVEPVPQTGAVYDVMVYPPYQAKNMAFCSRTCVVKYSAKETKGW